MVIFVIGVCCQDCVSVCQCSHGYLCLLSGLCLGVSVLTWLSLLSVSVVRIVCRCVSVHMVIVVCCQDCISVCQCSHGYLCYRCLLSGLCVGVHIVIFVVCCQVEIPTLVWRSTKNSSDF